ncbi:MAG: hypothetical protein KatS3mg060_3313 [Dehalococcoidia bacterium]|nr:MAG: hypothetical protein KatS3mg060_3313 [Dehalococcoidia bacterium]
MRQGLRSIDESTDRLTRLVHDLLEVSRIRLGRLSLALEAVELSSLIQRIAARYASAGVTFQYGGGPAHVRADPARFEQVLTNVLDNAVKYSSPGTPIEVALSRDGAGFLVTVTDDGIGLPSGAAAAIFEPFSRAANAARSQRPGLGLGLFIARQIVELHAGTISAESPGEDQGTTIRIWLPAAPADSLPATDPLREHPS